MSMVNELILMRQKIWSDAVDIGIKNHPTYTSLNKEEVLDWASFKLEEFDKLFNHLPITITKEGINDLVNSLKEETGEE